MAALQKAPSLFIDYRDDLDSLYYTPGFCTLRIRWGKFHFHQLQELELYVLNSEVMSSMKSSHQWNLGAYVSLKTLVGINRRQIQVLSFFWVPCSVQRHWPAASVIIPGFNLSMYWAIFSLITISANTKHIKGNNRRIFRRLVKMFTRISCETTAV